MTVTTEEAAQIAGVSVAQVRKWILAGHLEPVRRGARPLRFHYDDVARVQADLRTGAWLTRHRAATNLYETLASGVKS